MKLAERIDAFCRLGDSLRNLTVAETTSLAEAAENENPWFTSKSINLSLAGIRVLLDRQKLAPWAMSYSPEPPNPKSIGVAMAGNVPLVGFHDFLCVLLSGHYLKAKLSSQDAVMPKFILQKLLATEPRFSEWCSWEENLKGVDAMIATGSDNTSRYFDYYFRNIPHIIRKNRASCAVILGDETPEELTILGRDIFSYFGLGCRNVSKLYVPSTFDLGVLIQRWESFRDVVDHHKYVNNYHYRKCILLLDQAQFTDGGFILLRENSALVSPIAMLHYERYEGLQNLKEKLAGDVDKLQCLASARGWVTGSIPFGKAQTPEVSDYADRVDTMKFLTGLR